MVMKKATQKKQISRNKSVAQQMRRIAEQLIENFAPEYDIVNDVKAHFVHDLGNKLLNLGHSPSWMPKMLKKGYFALKDSNTETYYVFQTLKDAKEFKKNKTAR